MSASLVIVREVAGQETAQVPFAKDEYMIQTLAPDGADEPLREGVLPWAVRRREDFTDAHALHALPEHVTVRSATSMPILRSSPWILGGTPQGIGRGHPSDQGFDRGVDGRVARRAVPGKGGPVPAKAASLPAQHSGGSHDDEGLPPGGPHSGQPDPKEPIAPLKLRPVRRPLVDGQLLPQGEVLQGELAVAAAQEREESEQVEQEGDHRARIFSVSEQTDQPLAHRPEFWRRTGISTHCLASCTANVSAQRRA